MADDFYLRPLGNRGQPLPKISARIFLRDPLVAAQEAGIGIASIKLDGEACLGVGPTSSRVAVVDYNGEMDTVFAPVEFHSDGKGFKVGGRNPIDNFRFHQVNVWAIITHTLNTLEGERFFGRRIPWAFGRGRLLVLPHAGYWENAYYDRESGALHLFYFEGHDGNPVYTCLSHDIITHELGHAILDGLKPFYNEFSSPDTAGFHEYFGDAIALTSVLHHTDIVAEVVKREDVNLNAPNLLNNIAAEFGAGLGPAQEDPNRPANPTSPLVNLYLRTARNNKTMKDLKNVMEEHDFSEVLTGAYYDFFLGAHKAALRQVRAESGPRANPAGIRVSAVIRAAQVTSRMMLRALDYCPPADVDYLDYARAVMRADQVAYPTDPFQYRKIAAEVFRRRGICRSAKEIEAKRTLKNDDFRNLDVERLSASRTDAYAFLDANRKPLKIPPRANLDVVHVYRTKKVSANDYRPPQEIVLEFVWAEDVTLRGKQFGDLQGSKLPLWCGGTIVFNRDGNLMHYVVKECTNERKARFLRYIAYVVKEGYLSLDDGEHGLGARGQFGSRITGRYVNGRLRLHRAPSFRHICRSETNHDH